MGVFPEPALCADDARRLAPRLGTLPGPLRRRKSCGVLRRLAATPPAPRRHPAALTLALRLAIGLALGAALPQAALAPAASAHDRTPPTAEASMLRAAQWNGLRPPEESPPTVSLIAADLGGLAGGAVSGTGGAMRDPAEILRFESVGIPRWLVETILRAAAETEVDPVYLMALADKESSFSPTARAATSSAEGLFQFVSGTWLELVRSFGAKHGMALEAAAIESRAGQLVIADGDLRERVLGLRRDAYTAAVMAGEMMRRDRVRVEQRLGRELKRSECYLAHFFGAASAGRFMELADGKPRESAAALFRAAAQANRSLFYARAGKRLRGLSVGEVYARLDDMIDRRLERFQTVSGVSGLMAGAAPAARLDSALTLTR